MLGLDAQSDGLARYSVTGASLIRPNPSTVAPALTADLAASHTANYPVSLYSALTATSVAEAGVCPTPKTRAVRHHCGSHLLPLLLYSVLIVRLNAPNVS